MDIINPYYSVDDHPLIIWKLWEFRFPHMWCLWDLASTRGNCDRLLRRRGSKAGVGSGSPVGGRLLILEQKQPLQWWNDDSLSNTFGEWWQKKNKWHQMTCFINTSYLVGGFNPFEKYLSKWIISPSRDENKKYLKPPPSYGCQFPKKPDAMRGTALAPPSDRSGAPLGWASLPGDAASPRRCFKRNTLRIKHYIISKYIYISYMWYMSYTFIYAM